MTTLLLLCLLAADVPKEPPKAPDVEIIEGFGENIYWNSSRIRYRVQYALEDKVSLGKVTGLEFKQKDTDSIRYFTMIATVGTEKLEVKVGWKQEVPVNTQVLRSNLVGAILNR